MVYMTLTTANRLKTYTDVGSCTTGNLVRNVVFTVYFLFSFSLCVKIESISACHR